MSQHASQKTRKHRLECRVPPLLINVLLLEAEIAFHLLDSAIRQLCCLLTVLSFVEMQKPDLNSMPTEFDVVPDSTAMKGQMFLQFSVCSTEA
jgi:hypothetical protein